MRREFGGMLVTLNKDALCSFEFIVGNCWHLWAHSMELVNVTANAAVAFAVGCVPCGLVGDSATDGD